MRKILTLIGVLLLLFAVFGGNGGAKAAREKDKSPNFIFPLACSLGTDCWTVNYVDVGTDEGAKDYKCGSKTVQDHKGTDFAVRSLADIQRGIAVLAAKDGEILRVRNGETDTIKAPADLEAIRNEQKDCGNAVLIDHGPAGFKGLSTLYCHLKKDSITVQPGDKVSAGQKIAEIGHSGDTAFPHLHFGIVWEGGVMDPYTGLVNTQDCGNYKQSLWAPGQRLDYEPLSLYDAGFEGTIPDFDAIKGGKESPETLKSDSLAFVFWAGFYGIAKGDEITLKVIDPTARTFLERRIIQDETRERQFYYTGRRIRRPLQPGTYIGTAVIRRDGYEQTLKKSVNIR